MVRIPKKVKIGAHTFEVVITKDPFENNSELGQCDSIKQKILLLEGLSETQQFSTLLHEAVHAMNTTIKHETMDSLCEQISQFLLDNKFVK